MVRAEILTQALARAPKTLCPSEVARALSSDEWRDLMPLVRQEAEVLREAGDISVTQKGEAVSATEAKGPIRLALKGSLQPQ
ncbi:MAG: DUF3253 domain-containing protein [Pseudomonadota bacterium]